MEFFSTVVQYEPSNRMTAYNIAVTVGPNLFRQRQGGSSVDLTNQSVYYEAIVRMIEQHEVLFDMSLGYAQLISCLQESGVSSSNRSTPAKNKSQDNLDNI